MCSCIMARFALINTPRSPVSIQHTASKCARACPPPLLAATRGGSRSSAYIVSARESRPLLNGSPPDYSPRRAPVAVSGASAHIGRGQSFAPSRLQACAGRASVQNGSLMRGLLSPPPPAAFPTPLTTCRLRSADVRAPMLTLTFPTLSEWRLHFHPVSTFEATCVTI